MARIVDPFGKEVTAKGSTVAANVKEVDLPDVAEGRRWGIKVNGDLVTSGTVPTGDDDLLEIVDTARDIDAETLTQDSGDK